MTYEGYGCSGGGALLDGMIAMEPARVDPPISTFSSVHRGLAMGSIYLCTRWGTHGYVCSCAARPSGPTEFVLRSPWPVPSGPTRILGKQA